MKTRENGMRFVFENPPMRRALKKVLTACIAFSILALNGDTSLAGSIEIPPGEIGLSIGNSKRFTGLRINAVDHSVEDVKGVNITFWRAGENKTASYNGLSIGVIAPEGGDLTGFQVGGLGVAAKSDLSGVSLGLLGVGAGHDVSGLSFGFLGVGAGHDVTGISIGGLGVGTGHDITGLSFGLLGVGAGHDVTGVSIGGIASAAGSDITGISFGGIAAAAGGDLRGISIGGFGSGCGKDLTGATIALGMVKAEKGQLTGLAASAYNWLGDVKGCSVGIVNISDNLYGVQLGLINIVKNQSGIKRILPLINWNFK